MRRVIIVALLLSGCAVDSVTYTLENGEWERSATHKPWSSSDAFALGTAGAAVAFDLATTAYFTERCSNLREGNPILLGEDGSATFWVSAVGIKAVIAALTYWLGERAEEQDSRGREIAWYAFALPQLGAGAWNTYAITDRCN